MAGRAQQANWLAGGQADDSSFEFQLKINRRLKPSAHRRLRACAGVLERADCDDGLAPFDSSVLAERPEPLARWLVVVLRHDPLQRPVALRQQIGTDGQHVAGAQQRQCRRDRREGFHPGNHSVERDHSRAWRLADHLWQILGCEPEVADNRAAQQCSAGTVQSISRNLQQRQAHIDRRRRDWASGRQRLKQPPLLRPVGAAKANHVHAALVEPLADQRIDGVIGLHPVALVARRREGGRNRAPKPRLARAEVVLARCNYAASKAVT